MLLLLLAALTTPPAHASDVTCRARGAPPMRAPLDVYVSSGALSVEQIAERKAQDPRPAAEVEASMTDASGRVWAYSGTLLPARWEGRTIRLSADVARRTEPLSVHPRDGSPGRWTWTITHRGATCFVDVAAAPEPPPAPTPGPG